MAHSYYCKNRKATKELASQWGFELWYDPDLRLWVLQRKGYVEIEAPGGAYIAPRVLDNLPSTAFARIYLHIVDPHAFEWVQNIREDWNDD